MTISNFSPATLAVMFNDLANKVDDPDTDNAAHLRQTMAAIHNELQSIGFYMQYKPATYKLTRLKDLV